MHASRIRVLPEETVNRVAAGEVVERPAAALKELLENSLDAGATSVAVELAQTGRGLIRVADDGRGMSPDDVVLALERHATSKIATVDDLSGVATYGFRGEALPSIAAVSRLRVETRERGAAAGTRLEVDGGRIVRVAPCGCPEGTLVEVRDLFHCVPARLKFLRADATELGHCLHVATRLALACPQLGVALRHGGRDLLRLAAASGAGARLRDLLGPEFFAGLLPVRAAAGPLAVDGYVSRPGAGRPGQEYQQVFVNRRPVRDALLAQGLREACRDYFLQQPAGISYYLWISLPPHEVDVNVHPTKREVRFRDPGALRALVGAALRDALRADRAAALRPAQGVPLVGAGVGVGTGASDRPEGLRAAEGPAQPPYRAASAAPPALPAAERPAAQSALPAVDGFPARPETPAPAQVFGTYLVRTGPEGVLVVDQHAAHERVLFERLLANPARRASQQLLEPLLVDVSAAEAEVLEEVRTALGTVGVVVEPFGPRSWRVRALPPELAAGEADALVHEMAALALDASTATVAADFRRRAAALLACHAAIRAHQPLDPAEMAALLADLAACENPGTCPHGRPVSFTIDRAEIERRLKRV